MHRVPVRDPRPGGQALHRHHHRPHLQHRLQIHREIGYGVVPVQGDTRPHHVVTGLRVRDQRRRIRQMPHLRLQARSRDRRQEPLERVLLRRVRRMPHLVRAGHMAPRPRHDQRTRRLMLRRGLSDLRPLVLGHPAARHPRVALQMHPRRTPRPIRRRSDRVQLRARRHPELDPGPDHLGQAGLIRGEEERHHGRVRQIGPALQLPGLPERHHAEPRGPGLDRDPRGRNHAVPVGVGLDHRHHRDPGERRQGLDVVREPPPVGAGLGQSGHGAEFGIGQYAVVVDRHICKGTCPRGEGP